jgi:hypothetical protein
MATSKPLRASLVFFEKIFEMLFRVFSKDLKAVVWDSDYRDRYQQGPSKCSYGVILQVCIFPLGKSERLSGLGR